jgi:hypothetical protein
VLKRLALAFRTWWRIVTDGEYAERVAQVGAGQAAASGPDLRILAILQRDGRLIDFLMEEIDGYSDAQVGAAVRDIHRGCRKALQSYLTLEPVWNEAEESAVTVPAGFDPVAIRLTGNVAGSPPYQGRLKHHGWRVKAVQLPALAGTGTDQAVVAPAEVEVG